MENDIDQLLARRHTRRVGLPGSPKLARSRLELSKFIAERFVDYKWTLGIGLQLVIPKPDRSLGLFAHSSSNVFRRFCMGKLRRERHVKRSRTQRQEL
jgi:hypothetical protein